MNKIENKKEGLTLYTLNSSYSEDFTKNCGLTGGEIDNNFLFLRNNDIYSGEINEENNTLILKRGNNEVVTIPNIRKNTQINGGYVDNATGNLVLETNNNDIIITGFTKSITFTDITLDGEGVTNNPVRLSELYKSPFLPSAKTLIDLTNGETIDDTYKTIGTYIITKEYDNNYGLLYNFNGVEEIMSLLKKENSKWRVPSFKDWGEMLNALELCDDRNHLTVKNGDLGKFAGVYLKNGSLEWIEKNETAYSYGFNAKPCGIKIALNGKLLNYGETARFWSSDVNEYDEVWVKQLDYNKNTVKNTGGDKEGYYSLRLIRDYENVDLVNEEILENNYNIIKMPYVEIDAENNVTQRGYRIWTSVNVNFELDDKNNYTKVNVETGTPLFYLNYWNGKRWIKRLIEENNIVIIENEDNKEYKLENNNLIPFLNYKQDVIEDLETIRANSNKGASAVQPEGLKTINNINILISENESNINLNKFYYTKEEVNKKIKEYSLFEFVEKLPEENIDYNKIYIIYTNLSGDTNIFIEYIRIKGDDKTSDYWEKLGEFKNDVDLTDYVKFDNLKTNNIKLSENIIDEENEMPLYNEGENIQLVLNSLSNNIEKNKLYIEQLENKIVELEKSDIYNVIF